MMCENSAFKSSGEPSYLIPREQTRPVGISENIQKRFSFSTCDKGEDTISVFLRIRPNDRNTSGLSSNPRLSYDENENSVTIIKKAVENTYKFSHLLNPETDQKTVFNTCVRGYLQRFFDCQNVFLFTYGASNSGKTYTVQGEKHNPGLVPRSLVTVMKTLEDVIDENTCLCPEAGSSVVAMSDIEVEEKMSHKRKMLGLAKVMMPQISKTDGFISFSEMEKLKNDLEKMNVSNERGIYSVWLSFYEIYNEKVFDLLDEPREKRQPLLLNTDKDQIVYIKGLRHIQVNTIHEAFLLYAFGRFNLSISSTLVNDKSSRSHSIFNIKIVGRFPSDPFSYFQLSSFSICDLAGTERAHKTMNYGVRLKEAQRINNSFLVLNRCLRIIRENQMSDDKKHIPYRESKLTRILGPYFTSGEASLIILVTIANDDKYFEETEGILKSSSVATTIKPVAPQRPKALKKTRFSMAISKCMPGQSIDWSEVANDALAMGRDEAGCEPDIYKEMVQERNARLLAEQRLKELEEEHSRKVAILKDIASRESDAETIESLKQKLAKEEEDCRLERVQVLKLKKTIRLLNEEIDQLKNEKKTLESNNQNYLELLEDAKEEVELLQEDVKELQESVTSRNTLLAMKDEEIENLKMEKMELEGNLYYLREEKTELEEALQRKMKEIKSYEKQLADYEDKKLLLSRMTETPVINIDDSDDDCLLLSTPKHCLGNELSKENRKPYKLREVHVPVIKLDEDSIHSSSTVKSPEQELRPLRTRSADRNIYSDDDPSFVMPQNTRTTVRRKPQKKNANRIIPEYGNFLHPDAESSRKPRKLFTRSSGDLGSEDVSCLDIPDYKQTSPDTLLKTLRTGKIY